MTEIITTTQIVVMVLLFGLVFGIMLVAYEDGVPFGLLKKIKCKMGKHAFRSGYVRRMNRYFCKDCKSPRKHPALKAIDGGKRDFDNSFKF